MTDDPIGTWRRMRAADPGVTVLDLYDLVARQRGIAATELPADERYELARQVMPDVWPGWTTTEGSARRGDLIRVVDHDPAWAGRFEQWRRVLGNALGSTAARIEHVGSTAVPGLPAKPIVDVQVSVVALEDEGRYVPQIEATGVQLRSRDALHRYFRPFPGRLRDVHVHVCPVGSDWERDHLRFRDLLRADPAAREEYARVKRAAAKDWADDGIAYTDAKAAVIARILASDGEATTC